MAGKGSRKSEKISKKREKDSSLETFACGILSFILPLCGFPEEKIKSRFINQNADKPDTGVSAVVLNIALSKRDDWKTMFESRFKNSGFDTTEKIEKYLKSFLAITREFQKGDTSTKLHVSLAAYSEIMLFLNFKGIEIDFEQLIILWSRHVREISKSYPDEGELIYTFFTLFIPSKFFKWITPFMQEYATPYGCKDDVSKFFRQRSETIKKMAEERNYKLAEMFANLIPQTTNPPVLPAGFESVAVLPGDRESPEPPESPESNVREGEKKSRSRARSTGVSECVSESGRRNETSTGLEIADRLGQMSLSGETSPQEKAKRKKPKDRKSQ